jgi:hypothetical protein
LQRDKVQNKECEDYAEHWESQWTLAMQKALKLGIHSFTHMKEMNPHLTNEGSMFSPLAT